MADFLDITRENGMVTAIRSALVMAGAGAKACYA